MPSLELRVPPLLLALLAAAGTWAFSRFLPALNVPVPGRLSLAILAEVLGACCLFGAALQFRRVRTTLDPRTPGKASRMVSGGLYRVTRNPMYLGMALMLAGLALASGSIPGLLMVLAFCGYLTRFQIQPEEAAMLRAFGPEYEAYRSKVRRWI